MEGNTPYGEILYQIQQAEGETQKEMSERLKVSAAFLNKIMRGSKGVPEGFTRKVLEAYVLDEMTERILRISEIEKIEIPVRWASIGKKIIAIKIRDKIADMTEEDVQRVREALR